MDREWSSSPMGRTFRGVSTTGGQCEKCVYRSIREAVDSTDRLFARPLQNVNATSHNSLDLSIEDSGWEKLKQIHVDREGEHVHVLRPKVSSVYHRLLCEVKLVDNVKVVTFRSTFLVENRSLVNAEMVIVDANGKKSSKVYNIRQSPDLVLLICDVSFTHVNRIRYLQLLGKTALSRSSRPTTTGSRSDPMVRRLAVPVSKVRY